MVELVAALVALFAVLRMVLNHEPANAAMEFQQVAHLSYFIIVQVIYLLEVYCFISCISFHCKVPVSHKCYKTET
jgi:hypothetical protein